LNLLYGTGSNVATETGLSFGSTGLINFATGQTFPGTGTGDGTITGITTSSPLSGSGTTGSVALSLNTSALETTLDGVYAQLGASNTFTTAQTISGGASTELSVTTSNSGGTAVLGTGGSKGVSGTGTSYGIYGTSTAGTGVYGTSASTTGAPGVQGVSSTTADFGVGVIGEASGPGGYGVYGSANGSGAYGMYGYSTNATGTGVYGDSTGSTGYGIYGTGNTGIYGTSPSTTGGPGVQGASTTTSGFGVGVIGQAAGPGAYGVYGAANGAGGYGMYGSSTNATGTGVYGNSTGSTGYGIYGTGNTGVYGQSTTGNGVKGTSSAANVFSLEGDETGAGGVGLYAHASGLYAHAGVFPIGAYGLADNGLGVLGVAISNSATYGDSDFSGGVWGDTSGIGGSAALGGIVGTADDNAAGNFINNSTGFATVTATNNGTGPTGTAVPVITAIGAKGACGMNGSGDVACSGQMKTLAAVAGGEQKVEVYAVQSPENWFEDFGSANLENGRATVAIDPRFAQIVNTGVEFHVFLTPQGECEGLYVANKSAGGFEVRELHHGTSAVAFDYRIVAKRTGHEAERMTDATEEMHSLTKPRDDMAAHAKVRAGGKMAILNAPQEKKTEQR
jgi:hypothetical protein